MILARSIARDGIDGRSEVSRRRRRSPSSAPARRAPRTGSDARRWRRPSRPALDRYARDAHVVALGTYREAYERRTDVATELGALREAARDRERSSISSPIRCTRSRPSAPRDGETEELTAGRAAAHVERLMEQASAAEHVLTEEEGIADDAASLASLLENAADLDPRHARWRIARGIAAEIAELARDVRSWGTAPARPRAAGAPFGVASRRSSSAQVRPHRRRSSSLSEEHADPRRRRRSDRGAGAGAGGHIRRRPGPCGHRDGGRTRAAPALADAVRAELEELGMPGAVFEARLLPLDEPGPGGAERAELWFSASPGQPARPLARAASGGELSRVLLACRSVLADLDEVGTLVFDEVDAGIGGQAGLAVGRRLARLAAGRQVLVVTHLPQIACFADHHLRVSKEDGTASVELIDGPSRARELSRMLAGLAGSESAVTHAEELLAEAERLREVSRVPRQGGRRHLSLGLGYARTHPRDGRGRILAGEGPVASKLLRRRTARTLAGEGRGSIVARRSS